MDRAGDELVAHGAVSLAVSKLVQEWEKRSAGYAAGHVAGADAAALCQKGLVASAARFLEGTCLFTGPVVEVFKVVTAFV
jgi:hypothetical protein